MKVRLGRDSSGRPLVLDRQVVNMLHEAGRLLGHPLVVVQGSYMPPGKGAAASSTTHNGAGTADIRVAWGLPKGVDAWDVQRALRRVGFAAWVRDKQHGGFDPHVHAVALDVKGLDPQAQAQALAYLDHFNGLGHLGRGGPDYGPRTVVQTWKEYLRKFNVRRFKRRHPSFAAAAENPTRLRKFLRRHPKIAKQWLALGGA